MLAVVYRLSARRLWEKEIDLNERSSKSVLAWKAYLGEVLTPVISHRQALRLRALGVRYSPLNRQVGDACVKQSWRPVDAIRYHRAIENSDGIVDSAASDERRIRVQVCVSYQVGCCSSRGARVEVAYVLYEAESVSRSMPRLKGNRIRITKSPVLGSV